MARAKLLPIIPHSQSRADLCEGAMGGFPQRGQEIPSFLGIPRARASLRPRGSPAPPAARSRRFHVATLQSDLGSTQTVEAVVVLLVEDRSPPHPQGPDQFLDYRMWLLVVEGQDVDYIALKETRKTWARVNRPARRRTWEHQIG